MIADYRNDPSNHCITPGRERRNTMAHLIIESEEAYELARELADENQTSIENIVIQALREKSGRSVHSLPPEDTTATKPSPEELVARWMKITEGFGDRVKEPWKSTPHGDLLYDELGLPK
jgi:hypothetical protein